MAKEMAMGGAVKMILLLTFVLWLWLWIMLPTKLYKNNWTPNLNMNLNSTYFREQGMLIFFNSLSFSKYLILFSLFCFVINFFFMFFYRNKSSAFLISHHVNGSFGLFLSPFAEEIFRIRY